MTAETADAPLPAIIICASCRASDGGDGAAFAESLDLVLGESNLQGSVRVVTTECLNACGAPVSLALSGDGRATYIFNRVEPENDAPDILSTVSAWLAGDKGHIEDARVCGRLRFCLTARIPYV
ncbi:DUF1636 family protein [Fulvimarina sp. MAC8]|uniref:DUF1636 family protein n=1 Tax=Fulvimarina sp. MAC8 TaxID=3162874 RepID=UPI0032EC2F76